MNHEQMSGEPKCCECGCTVSYEIGFTMTGTLTDDSQDRIYCPACAPDAGKGYTLSDLQRMRESGLAERAKRQLAQMEKLGPDVYFHVTQSP